MLAYSGGFSLSAIDEFLGVQLRDQRLTNRLAEIVHSMAPDPALSFPELATNASELEAIYRFMRNDRISAAELLSGHVNQTRIRTLKEKSIVLVPHDTTDFMFGGHAERDGLVDLGGGYQGFLCHFSLAISADGSRRPIGVVAQESYVTKKRAQRHSKAQRKKDGTPVYDRWFRGICEAEKVLADAATPIHLLDREGDSFALFSQLVDRQSRFVIRCSQNRKLVNDHPTMSYLRETLKELDVVFERCVPVSKRKRSSSPKKRKAHPPRDERFARLRFGASLVTLNRPAAASKSLPKSLVLNLVHVWEVDVPEGETPIEWTLYTTEPINSTEEIERIVDYYRARWVIEEFFKSIKTGCGFEDRQLESFHALKNALALTIPMAWQLLTLRHLNRNAPDTSVESVFTNTQIAILKTLPKKKLKDEATVADAMDIIAKWGGHLSQNGPPGWIILGRGYRKLLAAVEIWEAATLAITSGIPKARDVINH